MQASYKKKRKIIKCTMYVLWKKLTLYSQHGYSGRGCEVKESDRARDWTRVNIGLAFTDWHEPKKVKECRTDAELAFLLEKQ